MAELSPLANVLAGPHLRTVAKLDGHKVVIVEPLRWVETKVKAIPTWTEQRIIHLMRSRGDWVSLTDISRSLDIAIGAVKVHIHKLRERGFGIESGSYGSHIYRLAEDAA